MSKKSSLIAVFSLYFSFSFIYLFIFHTTIEINKENWQAKLNIAMFMARKPEWKHEPYIRLGFLLKDAEVWNQIRIKERTQEKTKE